MLAPAALVTSACDLPSDLPRGWDTEFEVEATRSTLPVTQLLPSGIAQGTDRGSFTLALSPVNIDISLGAICPACSIANGLTVPKPAFQTTTASAVRLPNGVNASTIASGRLDVTIGNQLDFDPLRPSATARGSLTLTLRSGGDVVGAPAVVSGTDSALPPGGTLTRSFDLARATLTDPLSIEIAFDSPVGDPLTVDTTRRLIVTASGSQLVVGSANVRVTGKQVTSDESIFDLRDMDGFVRDHLKRGSLLLTVTNPFDVTGTLTLRIASATTTILKPVELAAGTQQREVEFTQEELRRIVGSELAVSVSGPVWGPAAGVVVTPRQALSIDASVRIILGPVQ